MIQPVDSHTVRHFTRRA